jgi:hypothetical protein
VLYSFELFAVFGLPMIALGLYHLRFNAENDSAIYRIGLFGTANFLAWIGLFLALAVWSAEGHKGVFYALLIYLTTAAPFISLVAVLWIRNNRDTKGSARYAYLLTLTYLWIFWGIPLILLLVVFTVASIIAIYLYLTYGSTRLF